jgi:hypothetical protein
MVSNPNGGYHIVQKQRSMYHDKVLARTWAPLIEEKEVTYIKWFLTDKRTGYWKGKEVGRNCSHLSPDRNEFTSCTTDVLLGFEDFTCRASNIP